MELAEVGDVDRDPGMLHARQDVDQRVLDRRVQVGHALLGELRHDRFDEVVHRERLVTGDRRRVGASAVEVELALGRRLVDRRGEAGVALDEVRQFVASLGRVEQVGADRRVELEPIEVEAAPEQTADQRLDVVTASPRRRQCLGDGTVVEVVGGDPRHARAVRVRDHRQPTQAAASRLALPRRGEVDSVERGEELRRRGGRLRRRDLRDQSLALVLAEHDRGRTERVGEAFGERPELEEVEQPPDLLHVRLHHERLGQLDGRVPAQDHHLVVLADPLLVLGE